MNLNQTQDSNPAAPSKVNAQGTGFKKQLSAWFQQHPKLTIIMVALVAVVINCYPIIFCSKSFVGPMLEHGSDTAAMSWWGVPTAFIESRSLLEHGELPLWNRYGHAGDTLIGQAVSMLGDPLHLIVLLGRGAAGAWDIKFLVAKFLFCVGFGLLMLRLLGLPPLAWLYTALAAYCGAFLYIYNHPVFFVFCYAPWLLLTAVAWLDLRSERYVRWGLVWLLANFACFNAGHVEVSVVLIGGLNLAALAYTLASHRNVVSWVKIVGRMSLATLFLGGLTAPVSMAFLAAQDGAYSLHTEVQVYQMPLTWLPGVFDDLFYLLVRADTEAALAPGASLLVLVGCLLSGLKWRQLRQEAFFWVNSSAILLWGGCIFGWIPVAILKAIPLLNRVGHTHTDFSYLLVIHLTIQSAYGFKCLATEQNFRRTLLDFLWAVLIFAGMLLGYGFGFPHQPMPWDYFLCAGAGAFGAPLLFVYLRSHYGKLSTLGCLGILILGFLPHFRFGFYSFGNKNLLMLPGQRIVLDEASPAIKKIKTDDAEPFRVVGFGGILIGDYAAIYSLEDIRSCAPLSNNELVNLIKKFPGMNLSMGWMLALTNPETAQPLLNLLNVKYVLCYVLGDSEARVEPGVDFRITDRSDFMVLENLQVWPRAFFTDKLVSHASSEAFRKHLLANGRQPFVSLAPDEIKKHPELLPLVNTNPAATFPATHYRLLPNSTEFDIHIPSAGVVCLTEGQAKDFTVTANHQPKEVLTVNRAFKGVYLDQPGDYHIAFIYRPRYWFLSCTLFWLSLVAAVTLAAMRVLHTRFERKDRNNVLIRL